MEDTELAALLSEQAFLQLRDDGLVHCLLSGHTMPPRAPVVRLYTRCSVIACTPLAR